MPNERLIGPDHVERDVLLATYGAVLAHDLSQPLMAARANVDAATRLMASGRLHVVELHETLHDVVACLARAADTIGRIRAQSGPALAPRAATDLNVLIADALRTWRERAAAAGVTIEVDLKEHLPLVMLAPVQAHLAFAAVLENAVEVDVRPDVPGRRVVVTTEQGMGSVEVRVRDFGTRITDETLSKLGDPFFTTKDGRLGLGLAMARRILVTHAGWVGVARGGAEGLIVTLRFPSADPLPQKTR